jgi:hypothetical protein
MSKWRRAAPVEFGDHASFEANVNMSGTLDITSTITATAGPHLFGDISPYGINLGLQTVAAAGSGQGDATAITSTSAGGAPCFVKVTGADNTKAVIMPALSLQSTGAMYLIFNSAASNTLEVFPATGDAIGPAADNAGITIAADTILLLICLDTVEWVGAELPVIGA